MELLDARRLTGPNLFGHEPGAILDIRCSADEAARLLECWEKNLPRIFDAVGWQRSESRHRLFAGGISLFFAAPIDVLYAASSLSERAWALCNAELDGSDAPDFDAMCAEIVEEAAAEANAPLLSLQRAAIEHHTAFLWDDALASLGHGQHSQVWPVRELPEVDTLDWKFFQEIPVALVTGTNGKTTTVRLAAHILGGAGQYVGLSSTEWISVNGQVVDRGDWSGPGGARAVLRHPEVQVAILETARGGLLRRGLGVGQAQVALITNIAEDHLGDFASQNMDELLDIKWIVSQAVEVNGTLVLNADDPLLVSRSAAYSRRIDWFSMDIDNPVVTAHTDSDGRAFVLAGEVLVRVDAGRRDTICRINEIPVALGGAARHNVANALAAAAVSCRLGATLAQVRAGLTSMSPHSNPGRCNLYDIRNFKVLVDFAHNPHAMRALFDMARAVPAKRRVLCFGQAGDRTDAQIRQLARSAWAIGLERVIISELAAYARGRPHGEVHALLRDELKKCGARDEQILYFEEESDSQDAALAWAQPGDLVIILALGGNASVHAKLSALGG